MWLTETGVNRVQQVRRIAQLCESVLGGHRLTREEARELAATEPQDLFFLFAAADRVRRRYVGDAVDLCAIVNARSGRCTENCKYCAQSKYHDTDVAVYPLLSETEILQRARDAEASGAARFAIVTSGKGMEGDREFPKILSAVRRILTETGLKVCCSLGALTPESARALKDAGVSRYHHNIETSEANYARICTSHTYDDRIRTIEIAQAAGLEVCSGGILGMNETLADRMDMAFALRDLGVHSIPLNLLNPIPGTPLAGQKPLLPLEILRSFALFRLIAPTCGIRTAGGREVNLRDLQALALCCGISGMLIGGYLTTGGRNCADDRRMLADLERSAAG